MESRPDVDAKDIANSKDSIPPFKTPLARAPSSSSSSATQGLSMKTPATKITSTTISASTIKGKGKDRGEALRSQLAAIQTPARPKPAPSKPSNVPFMPDWAKERPFLTGDYLLMHYQHELTDKAIPLYSMPLEMQETNLLEDMLFVLIGIEGRYIRVKANDDGDPIFYTSADVDKSHAEMIQRMLPICTHYVCLDKFVYSHSAYEYGMCYHAFCASLKELLNHWLVHVAQLETQFLQGILTLQKLWYYIQGQIPVLEALYKFIKQADKLNVKGGSLLNLLQHYTTVMGGDKKIKQIFLVLLRDASVPYMKMIEEWVYRGTVTDPYEEFMVVENTSVTQGTIGTDFNDNYWEKHYTLRDNTATTTTTTTTPTTQQPSPIPHFLQHVAPKILITGKYLNAIRETPDFHAAKKKKRKAIASAFASSAASAASASVSDFSFLQDAPPIAFTEKEHEYADKIERAHGFANKHLMDLLFKEKHLIKHLRNVKRFFLVEQGDWMEHFMDVALEELQKPVAKIEQWRLTALLQTSLQTSSVPLHPDDDDDRSDRDRLSCHLLPYSIQSQLLRIIHVQAEQNLSAESSTSSSFSFSASAGAAAESVEENEENLTGFDTFTIDYKVEWPISLIISRKVLTQYQLLFRHLLQCKRMSRRLCEAWLNQQQTKEITSSTLRPLLNRWNLLRQKMFHLVHTLERSMQYDVLEPNWLKLEARLREATTVEQVLNFVTDFLDTCLQQCLLTDPRLVKLKTKILTLCKIFADFSDRGFNAMELSSLHETRPTTVLERKERSEKMERLVRQVVESPGFIRSLERLEKNFNQTAVQMIESLTTFSPSTAVESHMAYLADKLNPNGFYTATSSH